MVCNFDILTYLSWEESESYLYCRKSSKISWTV